MRIALRLTLAAAAVAAMLLLAAVIGWQGGSGGADGDVGAAAAATAAVSVLPRPYLFVHVPKSGGTSIGKLAELPENGGPTFIRYWHHPVDPKVIQEMLTKDFVFGHFKWGIHRHFGVPCTYMTFLRDPVDRVRRSRRSKSNGIEC